MSISKNLSIAAEAPAFLRRVGLPAMIAIVALAGAFVAAKLIGKEDGIDGVNGFVESLSGNSSSFLGGLGLFAPLGFAFAAGMASAVNPCGFAMLPAYLGLYLGSNQEAQPTRQLGKALLVGLSVTAGFVVLFGTAGLIIALGARSAIVGILPWLGLGIGIILAVTGAWLVGGGKLYSGLAARAASHIGDPSRVSPKGYFLFGLSYGVASLGCTLPIFLTVVGTSLAVSDLGASFGQFLLYALGMGLVIMALTLGMAVAKGAMVGAVRKALPYVQPVGAWLMVIAGAYIVFYWLTLGDLM